MFWVLDSFGTPGLSKMFHHIDAVDPVEAVTQVFGGEWNVDPPEEGAVFWAHDNNDNHVLVIGEMKTFMVMDVLVRSEEPLTFKRVEAPDPVSAAIKVFGGDRSEWNFSAEKSDQAVSWAIGEREIIVVQLS